MNPPVIVIHGNSLEHVTASYKRFLEGRFRQGVRLGGYTASNRDEDFSQSVQGGRRGVMLGHIAGCPHDCSGCALPFVSEG